MLQYSLSTSIECRSSCSAMQCQLPPAAYLSATKRYPRLDGRIGEGSFGAIYCSIDQLSQELVAVKKQRFSKSAQRELAAYEVLRVWPHRNIVSFLNRFIEKDPTQQNAMLLYLVLEHVGSSLWHVYNTPLGQRGLHVACQQYVRGTFAGLRHLHGLNLAHGDLTLANILVDHNHRVKICDMGTCHCAHGELFKKPCMTPYIQPPEVLERKSFQCGEFGDCWALGMDTLILMTGEMPCPVDPVGTYEIPLPGTKNDAELAQRSLRSIQESLGQQCCEIRSFMASRPTARPLGDGHPAIEWVSSLMQWEASARAKLCTINSEWLPGDDEGARRGGFPAGVNEGQPVGLTEEQSTALSGHDPSTVRTSTLTSTGLLTTPPGDEGEAGRVVPVPVKGVTQYSCECKGQCGHPVCKKRHNARRFQQPEDWEIVCQQTRRAGSGFCARCSCEVEGCLGKRSKINDNPRWCSHHCKQFRDAGPNQYYRVLVFLFGMLEAR